MQDRRRDRSPVRVEALKKQLEHVAREGGFELMVLQDDSGHVVQEFQRTDDDHEWDMAAFHRVLAGFKALLAQQLGLHRPTEVTVLAMGGARLSCRRFDYGDSELSLTIVTRNSIPSELVDRTVTGVQRILAAADL